MANRTIMEARALENRWPHATGQAFVISIFAFVQYAALASLQHVLCSAIYDQMHNLRPIQRHLSNRLCARDCVSIDIHIDGRVRVCVSTLIEEFTARAK